MPGARLVDVTGERVAADDPRAGVFERVFVKPPGLDGLVRSLTAAG